MTRVLYVAADPALTLEQQGGAGTHMRGTIAALERQGLEVDALVGGPAAAGAAPTVAQRAAPRALRGLVPSRARVLARDLRLLAHARAVRAAVSGPYDCVYERSAYLVDAGRALAERRGVPYLLETDGLLVAVRRDTYGAPLGWHAEAVERRKVAAADAVVVMSEASADAVGRTYRVEPERLLVKGLGVERELAERPPAAEPSVDVGFAGTFQAYHGLDLLVTALRRLPGRTALIVGDGPRRMAVETAAASLPVELTGLLPHDEALRRLAGCRVLVVPESAETIYPVKVLEYAALRRPVVCPDRRAFDELERDGEPALYRFRPGDAADLARAIEEALASGLDERVGRLAALVAAGYTWDAVGARVAERIRALVEA